MIEQLKYNEAGEPLSGVNYAAEIINDRTNHTRTLPIAPGLTNAEATDYVKQYLGPDERIAQFVKYT